MKLFPFLNQADNAKVAQVLRDLGSNISGEWVLAGSLAYRLFLPRQARPHLSDVDIALNPQDDDQAKVMVRPTISDHFYVTHIYDTNAGYYFGMVHKATGLWVDVFTPPHRVRNKKFGDLRAQLPEETLFAIVKDLLWRSGSQRIVKAKWLTTAHMLWEYGDQDVVLGLMKQYKDEYADLLPAGLKASPKDVMDHVLSHIKEHQPEETGPEYPDDCVETANGISIVDPKEYEQAMNLQRGS